MRDPVRDQLDTIRALSERLLLDHRTVTDQLMRALSPQPSAGDALADADVELTGVEAATLRRIRSKATEYQNWIEAALRDLTFADTIRGYHVGQATTNTKPAADLYRCDGGAGDWADPTCERLSVRGAWVEGRHHELCDACRQRYYRWLKREQVA